MKDFSSSYFDNSHGGIWVKWATVPSKLDFRINIAVSWLLEIQDKKGFWDSRGPWLTGVAIKTLVMAKSKLPQFSSQIDTAIQKGIKWLITDGVGNKHPHGGMAWDPNLGTWDTAVILRGLLSAGSLDKDVINGTKTWLQEQMSKTYSYFGSTTVPFGASYPAQTLLALEEAGENIYSKSVGKDFADSQLKDGSWGDHFNTAEVLQYLTRHKKGNEDIIKNATNYIQRTQAKNGTWSSLTWPTAITLISYIESGQNPYTLTTVRALEYLSAQQHSNGSWFHLLADTIFATQALVVATEKLNFSEFDRISDEDFKMSSLTVMPTDVVSEPQTEKKVDTIEISLRTFTAIRLSFVVILVYLSYTIYSFITTTLSLGWATLSTAQQIDFIFKLLAAILSALIGLLGTQLIAFLKRKE